MYKRKKVEIPDYLLGRCGECEHCTPVKRFHTLNIHGEPTLGTCPYWFSSKCVLLSQAACEEHFKKKVV